MGTRSIIMVVGKQTDYSENTKVVRLYRHWDGSPDDQLPTLLQAIRQGNKHFEHFQVLRPEAKVTDWPAEGLAAAIIASSLCWDGASVRHDRDENDRATYQGPIEPYMYGNQSDLEWVYVVDAQTRTIKVYGGGYGSAEEHLDHGLVNPLLYVNCIREQYQEEVKNKIVIAVSELNVEGWKVNPTVARKRKAKQKQ